MTRVALVTCLSLFALAAPVARAQAPVDSALAAYIACIKAIDIHAHPMRPIPKSAPPDSE